MATTKRCEGRRRMWRGNTLGTFKCGRKAKYVFQSYVGYSTTHYVCGDNECVASVASGYPTQNWRQL